MMHLSLRRMRTRTTAQADLDAQLGVWYVRCMQLDLYDEDLPEPYMTLVESMRHNKETLVTVSKVVGIPVSAFLLTCAFNYYVKKRLETL